MRLKPLVPLCLAAFAGFLNLFGMNPFFVDIAADTGTTVSIVGYTSTVALLTTAIAGAILGPVAERIGVRRTLVVGIIIASAGALLTGGSVNLGVLVGSRVLAGIGGSITGGVTIAMAALIYEGRERQRALAIVTASMAMAVVIGVFLMAAMAEPYGWRGAYASLGGFLILIALLNRLMLEPDDHSRRDAAPGGLKVLADAYRPILSHQPLRRLLVACTLHPAVINGSTAYIGAFLVSQHDLSTSIVGLVFSLIGGTYFVGNLLAGGMNPRQPHLIFSSGVVLMGLFWAFGYLIALPPVVIAVSFGIATFTGGIAWVVLLGMLAERTPENIGTAMVLSSSLLSLGGAIGIAVSAGLLDINGYGALAVGTLAIAVLAGLAGWVRPIDEPAGARAVSVEQYRPRDGHTSAD